MPGTAIAGRAGSGCRGRATLRRGGRSRNAPEDEWATGSPRLALHSRRASPSSEERHGRPPPGTRLDGEALSKAAMQAASIGTSADIAAIGSGRAEAGRGPPSRERDACGPPFCAMTARSVSTAAAGEAWAGTGLVSELGTALDANVRRTFRDAFRAAEGIDAAEWTPRQLRHSFVSLLSDSGVALEEIAPRRAPERRGDGAGAPQADPSGSAGRCCRDGPDLPARVAETVTR
ncbi:MAG: site-specific integrase [Actinotalea sp.]|nr:site-specific integrase [Actinotalea sp.]